MTLIFFLAGLVVGVGGYGLYLRSRETASSPGAAAADPVVERAPESENAKSDEPTEAALDRLSRLRREIEGQDDRIQQPDDLLTNDAFRQAVDLLAGSEFPPAQIIEYLGSAGYVLPCIAACALPRRTDVDAAAALGATMPFGSYPLKFVLDYLETRETAEHLPLLLRHAREWWWDATAVRQRLRKHFRWAENHSPGTAPAAIRDLDEDALQEARTALARFEEPLLKDFIAQLDGELQGRRERRVLGSIGRLWATPRADLVMHAELRHQIDRLVEMLSRPSPRPILLSGEHGVGKSVLIDAVFAHLAQEDWLLFEGSAAEVLAGQKYIGELEERTAGMFAALKRPKALWRVPDFFDLLNKGSHSQDPRGILDLALPAIERHELLMVGEIRPQQLAQMLIARPAIRQHFEILVLPALAQDALEALCLQWADARAKVLQSEVADARLLAEARRMAAQFFPEQHEPGRVLRLLEESLRESARAEPPALPLDQDALLDAIAARSGLPLDVIDDRQRLDLDSIRRFFRERVIGQDEAVECLVDRIAMLKAGLSDGNRPVGVFLFAGPTGTGKTEMAKTLAELLFGSGERLLRLDMSEYQSDDAAWRLIDDDRHGGSRSLVSRIREQPFSVVLLDEFEKASPRVWDLFLQVFDDGRLSDRSGHVADFRHSIIILTSNVGSTLARNAGPGFTSAAGGYSRSTVEKALNETFRREFLNRIDRVVLFNPLDRSLMRDILHKELDRAMNRRGLRNRDWAVEWEPSAIEFLLDRGFTPDLGARPLRRAIEHHLLAPLARRIVEHRAPAGGQFLFARAAGQHLEVEFVDPDADEMVREPARLSDGIDLASLIRTPSVDANAIAVLEARYDDLVDTVESDEWLSARGRDFAAMAEAGFWQRSDRFEPLDRIERRDRIESALQTARRLLDRLRRDGGNAEFAARVAQLLWLLGMAAESLREGAPQDALILVSVGEADLRRDGAQARQWWRQMLGMYLSWAEKRNMRVEVLRQDNQQCSAWLSISGFGALALLREEAGLHVLELESDDGSARRNVVRVQVEGDRAGARRVPPNVPTEAQVRRRYRQGPAPLVRDALLGWRSGRFERVLGGDFDIMSTDG